MPDLPLACLPLHSSPVSTWTCCVFVIRRVRDPVGLSYTIGLWHLEVKWYYETWLRDTRASWLIFECLDLHISHISYTLPLLSLILNKQRLPSSLNLIFLWGPSCLLNIVAFLNVKVTIMLEILVRTLCGVIYKLSAHTESAIDIEIGMSVCPPF